WHNRCRGTINNQRRLIWTARKPGYACFLRSASCSYSCCWSVEGALSPCLSLITLVGGALPLLPFLPSLALLGLLPSLALLVHHSYTSTSSNWMATPTLPPHLPAQPHQAAPQPSSLSRPL